MMEILRNWGSGIVGVWGYVVGKFSMAVNWFDCSSQELLIRLSILAVVCQLIHAGCRGVRFVYKAVRKVK